MPKVSKTQLRQWFVTAAKPLQGQYWDWQDSYWHKDELIPIDRIEELQEILNTIGALPPLTGTINAGGGTIALAGGRLYRDIFLSGIGKVSIGITEGGTEILDDVDINLAGEDFYHTYINKKRLAAFTLYITCENTLTYEIYRV